MDKPQSTQSNDIVLARQHIRHAIQHLRIADEALAEGQLVWALQNINDGRTDTFYARKHARKELGL